MSPHSDNQADEETPLLQNEPTSKKAKRTPLPWRQFAILLILQISEPLTSQVISPFAPQLIRDIGITHGDEARVGYYVGLMHSLLFATEALTIFHWSQISDHIGRKPVLIIGLFGLSISMFCFGLSKTFLQLVISRCFNGALNGNIGVMKSMVAEITDSTNMPQAYAYLPFAWSSGTTLGPLIGGSLARPADRFPNVFGHSSFFKTYPYFLPCAVPATVSALSLFITLFFLKETVHSRVSIRNFLLRREEKSAPRITSHETGASDSDSSSHTSDQNLTKTDKPVPFRALFIPRVFVAAGSYAAVALADIAFRTVQPVFYSTPIELGGLGLEPPAIGTILAILGLSNGIFQGLFFAKLHDRLGPKNMYLFSVIAALPKMAMFPIISSLARGNYSSLCIYTVVGMQLLLSVVFNFSYGVTFMYINDSAPNRASIGATNGLAQTIVSVMRAIGPAAANSAFSISIEKQYLGGNLVYCIMTGMVFLAIGVGIMLPRHGWKN
ncbi:major facilitator superfamily domain-containing protein [Hygrophoropsis aurantiaca]|uniref:Major facilitator superfamily domain-containing protein n=1 Tax=Hygrophoropsis aurantiaca TaxID=72124 RepID=A0ACB8APZ5_9AGAM|nr:major facilitator superfamily domain-containing protein [Hygrophoropsis aurantiaca]